MTGPASSSSARRRAIQLEGTGTRRTLALLALLALAGRRRHRPILVAVVSPRGGRCRSCSSEHVQRRRSQRRGTRTRRRVGLRGARPRARRRGDGPMSSPLSLASSSAWASAGRLELAAAEGGEAIRKRRGAREGRSGGKGGRGRLQQLPARIGSRRPPVRLATTTYQPPGNPPPANPSPLPRMPTSSHVPF